MSARIIVNLAQGLADCAVDRTPDGGTWLSLRQGPEVVIVKLTTPSLEMLQRALAKELANTSGEDPAPGEGR